MPRIKAYLGAIGLALLAVAAGASAHAASLPPELQKLADGKVKNKKLKVEALPDLDALSLGQRDDVARVGDILWKCIQKGQQVVLYSSGAFCTGIYDGEKLLRDADPKEFDPAVACKTKRVLPANVIRWLGGKTAEILKPPKFVSQKTYVTAGLPEGATAAAKPPEPPNVKVLQTKGIRIIGAVFCDSELNLSDLTLAHPLTLDRGVFKSGIRAENLKVAGNLSFGGAYIYDNLAIGNSIINGTLYGRGAFIQRIRIYDTEALDNFRF